MDDQPTTPALGEPFNGPHNASTYRRGCRCDVCRRANTEKCAEKRRRRAAAVEAGSDRVPHGIGGYVNWGCRCDVCSAAGSAANAAMRARPAREDKHGTPLNFARGCRCGRCVAVGNPSGIQRGSRTHGLAGYNKRGCRCDICRAAGAEYRRRRTSELLISDDRHGSADNYVAGCRCDMCRSWMSAKSLRYARKTGWKAQRDAARKSQAESLDRAANYGKEWTGPELETLARDDLTNRAAAALLRRTIYAVRTKRRLIRDEDPRVMAMLGRLYR